MADIQMRRAIADIICAAIASVIVFVFVWHLSPPSLLTERTILICLVFVPVSILEWRRLPSRDMREWVYLFVGATLVTVMLILVDCSGTIPLTFTVLSCPGFSSVTVILTVLSLCGMLMSFVGMLHAQVLKRLNMRST
jgi:hypothetical protein